MPLPTRIGRLRPPVLCLVVTGSNKAEDIEKTVAAAVAGGVNMVLLSAGGLAAGELFELATRLKTATRGQALLVIEDRIDVVQAVEADGALVLENGLPTRSSRVLVGKYALLGRSAASSDAAFQASREGAEYIVVDAALPALITEITKDSAIPVLARGNVTAAKISDLVKAGAAGIAVDKPLINAADPKATAEELGKSLKEAWTARTEVALANISP